MSVVNWVNTCRGGGGVGDVNSHGRLFGIVKWLVLPCSACKRSLNTLADGISTWDHAAIYSTRHIFRPDIRRQEHGLRKTRMDLCSDVLMNTANVSQLRSPLNALTRKLAGVDVIFEDCHRMETRDVGRGSVLW